VAFVRFVSGGLFVSRCRQHGDVTHLPTQILADGSFTRRGTLCSRHVGICPAITGHDTRSTSRERRQVRNLHGVIHDRPPPMTSSSESGPPQTRDAVALALRSYQHLLGHWRVPSDALPASARAVDGPWLLSGNRGRLSLMTNPTRINSATATMTATHSHSVGQCMNDRLERLSSCCVATDLAYSPRAGASPPI